MYLVSSKLVFAVRESLGRRFEMDWRVIGAVHLKAQRATRIDPAPGGLSFQSHADRGLTLIGERCAIIYVFGEGSAG